MQEKDQHLRIKVAVFVCDIWDDMPYYCLLVNLVLFPG